MSGTSAMTGTSAITGEGFEGPLTVAVDGPTAAGKGTLARRIADHYGLAYLDTGSLYRKVGYLALEAGEDPSEEQAAVKAAQALSSSTIADYLIRTDRVGAAASKVAAIPAVRSALLEYQRQFAANPPGNSASDEDGSEDCGGGADPGKDKPRREVRGAVLDGRDIGTVVCPDALVKLFVTADQAVRAKRRFDQFAGSGTKTSLEQVLKDLKARDDRDMKRDLAPLRPASDAHLLDTTDLSIEAAFKAACGIIDRMLR